MNTGKPYPGKRVLKRFAVLALLILVVFFCLHVFTRGDNPVPATDTSHLSALVLPAAKKDSIPDTARIVAQLPVRADEQVSILVGRTGPGAVVNFAKTLLGVPYVYASSDPATGFDCSGFITYVFKHFGIEVPRSSIDFTSVGKTVPIENAKEGDLILFTGTNEFEKFIGHMGLVVSNDPVQGLSFIHATSGKAMAVTISPFSEQYKKRFIRISRIFPQNG